MDTQDFSYRKFLNKEFVDSIATKIHIRSEPNMYQLLVLQTDTYLGGETLVDPPVLIAAILLYFSICLKMGGKVVKAHLSDLRDRCRNCLAKAFSCEEENGESDMVEILHYLLFHHIDIEESLHAIDCDIRDVFPETPGLFKWLKNFDNGSDDLRYKARYAMGMLSFFGIDVSSQLDTVTFYLNDKPTNKEEKPVNATEDSADRREREAEESDPYQNLTAEISRYIPYIGKRIERNVFAEPDASFHVFLQQTKLVLSTNDAPTKVFRTLRICNVEDIVQVLQEAFEKRKNYGDSDEWFRQIIEEIRRMDAHVYVKRKKSILSILSDLLSPDERRMYLDRIEKIIRPETHTVNVLGEYIPNQNKIVLYVKTIDRVRERGVSFGENLLRVLAHEVFHAYHFFRCQKVGQTWPTESDSKGTVVVESLARCYECLYTGNKTIRESLRKEMNESDMDDNPYSGAKYIIDAVDTSGESVTETLLAELLDLSTQNWDLAYKQLDNRRWN